jgi:FkbM family methyltransferase
VVVFEPHPELGKVLRENLERWAPYDIAPIKAEPIGLSSVSGSRVLYESEEFASNQGSASVERPGHVINSYAIITTSLDDYFPTEVISLIKLDVEGHEAAVLEGAARALRELRIRDIIFEELRQPPQRSTEILESAGYEVFTLYAPTSGPSFMPWREFQENRPEGFSSHNYLATLNAQRANARFRPWGWRCLRSRVPRR